MRSNYLKLLLVLFLLLVGCGKSQEQIDAENRALELQEENESLRDSIDEARQHIDDANDALEQRRLDEAEDELDSARNSIYE